MRSEDHMADFYLAFKQYVKCGENNVRYTENAENAEYFYKLKLFFLKNNFMYLVSR